MAMSVASKKSPGFVSAVTSVKQVVLDPRFEPGYLFTEPKLARMFGFARLHIRAAVEQLTADGMITVLSRRGFTVNEGIVSRRPNLDMEALEAVYGKRFLLEGHVVSKLAEGGGTFDTGPFHESLAWQEELLAKNQIASFHAYDLEFHAKLFQTYGSDSLLNKFKNIAAQLYSVWEDDGKDHRPAREILREHANICFWINRGNAAKAVDELYRHFATSHKCTRSALSRKEERPSYA